MYLTLPESSASRKRVTPGYAFSIISHGVVVVAMLAAGSAPEGVIDDELGVINLLFKPDPAKPSSRQASGGVEIAAASSMLHVPSVPSLHLSVDIDPALPEVTAFGSGFSPSAFDNHEFDPPAGGAVPASAFGGALPIERVEKPARASNTVVPRYPAVLAGAGVEGSVTMRFVVDTLGRVEVGSVTILRSSHPLFEAAVRDALVRMRFWAAEVENRKVRQLVEQSFHFTLVR